MHLRCLFLMTRAIASDLVGVKLPAKECLLSLLYLKLECPMFLRQQQRCNRVLTGRSQAPMTELQLARKGLLCRRRLLRQDRAHRPGSEPRAKLRGSGERHCPLPCPSALQWGAGTATKASTRSPRVPACRPPARGSGDAQGPARPPGTSTLAAFVCGVLIARA